MLMVMLLCVTV